MLFSSLVFLVLFLPFTLLGYYAVPAKLKNPFLFLMSMVFFAWGGVSYSAILILSILINYIFGIQIERRRNSKTYLIVGVSFNLLLLVVFKYANFLIENLNALFTVFKIPSIENPSILLPVGISFYTFQSLSYLVDVYRKTTKAQTNFVNLGLYISLFPQLIAGPIVRYHDIQKQLSKRSVSYEKFSEGVIRFTIGFGKKIIIANNLAYVADEIFALAPDAMNPYYAWLGIIAYSLQIYYDFSGYSDMAIGLGKMFGFDFLENFNFPYIATSIKEFWRRWHISLSNWFRDYLYIPLGGNRKGKNRTILNLFIVFFITGFWHGASWNFIIWGLIHGTFLFLERSPMVKWFKGTPQYLAHFYTILVAVLAWVFFRAVDFNSAISYYQALFGGYNAPLNWFFISKIINLETLIIFGIAILGASGLLNGLYFNTMANVLWGRSIKNETRTWMYFGIVVLMVLFIILYGFGNLVIGSYNPFIYFRF